MGIDFQDLSKVFQLFTEKVYPELQGQIQIGKDETRNNFTNILNTLNVRKEKKKVEDILSKVCRDPSQEILPFFQPLANMYTAYFSLSNIKLRETSSFVGKKIENESVKMARRAIISCCSEKAQTDINNAISSSYTELTK